MIGAIAAYFLPLLERDREAGLVAAGVDLAPVAEYVARLSLSLIASPGRHDLADRPRCATWCGASCSEGC